jgi:hypothetical protein
MSRLNLWFLAAILLAACGGPTTNSVKPLTPTSIVNRLPPTWTPLPRTPRSQTPRSGTQTPTPTRGPTRTPAPIVTPAASRVYTATDGAFTLELPSNWSTQSGQRQMIGRQAQQMQYVAVGSPGTAPQPAVIIFYGWPASSPITSDTAWESAYAIASLAIKVCPVTLTVGGSIALDGEPGKYIGYQDSCGVQGELIGLVHGDVNYGVLIEAPQAAWAEWRMPLRDLIGTLKFGP